MGDEIIDPADVASTDWNSMEYVVTDNYIELFFCDDNWGRVGCHI